MHHLPDQLNQLRWSYFTLGQDVVPADKQTDITTTQ